MGSLQLQMMMQQQQQQWRYMNHGAAAAVGYARNHILLHKHKTMRSTMFANRFPGTCVELKMAGYGGSSKKSSITMVTRNDWDVCHSLFKKVALRHGFSISPLHQVPTQLQKPIIILVLVLQALDIYEDDMIIEPDSKIPFLKAFHRYIYNPDLKIPSGTTDLKDLVDQFHHVQNAFLDLDKSHQEAIEDSAKEMGGGMAKFINKEIETIDDYNEYCHHAGVVPLFGFSKIIHASGLDDLAPHNLISSMGVFAQKADAIRDYLVDINDTPKPRMLWPRQIWSKYVTKLEDFKYEENSTKALLCLNELITDALLHVEDCLKYLSIIRDPSAFQAFSFYEVNAIRVLALCYNNIDVFRRGVNLNPDISLRIATKTRTMTDVYASFFKYTSLIKSKAEKNAPNAVETLGMLEEIQKICRDSQINY